MRSRTLTASASALLLFSASVTHAKHNHVHLDTLYKRHHAHREQHRSVPEAGESGIALRSPNKRDGKGDQCRFPNDAGLVAVTPHEQNAGWAMSPDQPCVPGSYCPYACPPGQVMMQWDPEATSYSYPKSMNGGLYCDKEGKIQKPFPEKPYCQDAKAGIGAISKASGPVSFCQTVLPGNEAMLIPTHVQEWTELAVPGTDYWCGTAAHYYINPPGTGCDEACVWGTKDNPVGNWSPYVAGANVDKSGGSFIKLGWNPIYLEDATPFKDEMPNWGVKVECDGEGCNGLPCAIDPAKNKVNEMIGSSSDGAGGGAFCVVTVPKGVTASFVVFDESGGSGPIGNGDDGKGQDSPEPDFGPPELGSPEPGPPEPTAAPSSSADAPSSTYDSPSVSSSGWSDISSSIDYSTYSMDASRSSTRSSTASRPMYSPHEFVENSTSTYAANSAQVTASTSQTSAVAAARTGGASTVQLSFASLLMSSLIVFMTFAFAS
ncbi:hypothetical protein EPUS_00072 [Endocarpon pusillum Z07020]|uniref:Uncharacterized protein n=1 Tax=Endocarpon pusillum (strain Z07020 / HMAS-L-300199) TaxID=1263415 RepID=U1HWW7_ENDPU|nr:uncharacterized protein EPUS_00072 [Endocarpon pusillum Z07020]ERF75280.1 hypothetical protein EPUS_00072 [Endocarpon pusillum Z07020]